MDATSSSRRRRTRPRPGFQHAHSMKASAVAALLLLGGVTAQAQCSSAPQTLSTSCDDLCAQYEPCLAYNVSAASGSACSDASCVTDDDDVCTFQCFTQPLADPSTFTFLVPFGSYESSREAAASSGSASIDAQVAALPDETDTYASASNDALAVISTIELSPAATTFIVAGGSSSSASVKSKVAKVSFGADVISSQTNVTSVELRSLDLSDSATLNQLPVVLPSSVQNLSLPNTLLASFPSLVANFSSLQSLNLDQNYLTSVVATAALNSLKYLSFEDNALAGFHAVFPNLVTLSLVGNNLTSIPAAIFIHAELETLQLKGNPLEEPVFTEDQANFLEQLDSLDLENSDFTKDVDDVCRSLQRTIHSLTVCISDADSNDDDDSTDTATGSKSSSTSTLLIAGIVVGGVLLLAGVAVLGVCVYRKRQRKEQDRVSKYIRESFFGGGVSPPLARSQTDKGYRGGRRTPVNGGPRIAADDYDDANCDYSPRISTRSTHSNNSSTAYSLWSDDELLSLQVRFEDVEDIGTIGSGAFGVIWLVKYRGSQLLASKRLRSDQVTKQRTQAFVEEIKMVSAFDHPNIVKFVGAAWTIESDLQALFEYMENGDLRDYLAQPDSPRHWSQELLQMAVDIVEALVYVHSFTPPLVHRDLKSRNVLLSGDMKAKLTDFGASRYKSVDETMTAAVGTGRWLAPEVISGSSKYDQSVDIYSFGVVLSEIDTHAIPYDDVRSANGNKLNDIAILQLVATGQLRPKFSVSCPPELRQLAERCLDQDPEKRPPAHVVAYELRVIQRSHYTLL